MVTDIKARQKVLIFIPEFPVLSETFIEREICELQKRANIDLVVCSLKKASDFNCPQLSKITKYVKLNLVDVVLGFTQFAVNSPKELILNLKTALVNKNRNLFDNLYLWLKSAGFARIFGAEFPDRLHVHFFSEPSTLGLYASNLLKIKFSISAHARDIFAANSDPINNGELIKQKVAAASFVTLCNKKAYDFCIKNVSPSDANKVFLNYHGLALPENFILKTNTTEIPKIVYVGRFVQKKGLNYLIDAAYQLNNSGEKFELFLAGYGSEYTTLVKQVNALNLNSIVHFVNDGQGVSSIEALELISSADIFVSPSVDMDGGDSDGIPNNLLEAGLLSKPIVSTNAGSINEILTDRITGLQVAQKDSSQLAIAIKTLLHNKDQKIVLGNNLHKLVSEKFDIKSNIIALEEQLLK